MDMSFNEKVNREVLDSFYEDKISKAKDIIDKADAIVIGIGAGMSAAGGINYMDKALVKIWFPEYYEQGFKGLMEIQSVFWNLTSENVLGYWGYWARHIDYIRYKSEVLEPYKNLYEILKDKNYFICTTNADGQVQKAGFDIDKIFAPQGNYESFQCIKPCTYDDIFENKHMIDKMVKSINENYEISENAIPRCPHCGDYLIPNLRCDSSFVENPHMKNIKDYQDFIGKYEDKNILFIELGVGYNTPGIIRYPFEKMVYDCKNGNFIRVNKGRATVPKEIDDKSITIDADINKVLKNIKEL